ncbi:caspase family protein [Alsobacter sp. R-9]
MIRCLVRVLAARVLVLPCVLAGLVMLGFAPVSSAWAQKRVALLIGNSSYSSVPKLVNPSNDVAAMERLLKEAGFDTVMTAVDLDERGVRRALLNFEDASQGADVGLIFYSGHGIELNGQNYLVPVDARLMSDRVVDDEAIPLDRVLRSMDNVKRLKLVILDACRDNPFLQSMARTGASRSVGRGLARIEPQGPDTLIAYAAKAGTVAEDGDGRNSPFTSALLRHLATPGLDVRLAFGLVRDDVMAATRNRQEPFVYGSLGGALLSVRKADAPSPAPASAAPAPSASASAPAADICGPAASHWTEARTFDRIDFYEEHVRLFGSCAFAGFARAKIDELRRRSASVAPAAVAPAPQAPAAATAPGPNDCDRLAARPYDPKAVAPGVGMLEMDGAAAMAACTRALAQDPDEPRFMFQLGRSLHRLKQPDQAVRFYQDAWSKDYPAAGSALAYAYAEGDGVAADPKQAEQLYKAAAGKGDTQAMHNLGWLYDGGRGVARNPKEAARLVIGAIEKGNAASLAQVSDGSDAWSQEFRKEIQELLRQRKALAGPVEPKFSDRTRAALRTVAGTAGPGTTSP